jgi:membrane glycosyltransferase
MDLMSERGAFFDLTSSRSVAYDTVISTSDRVEIPVDAPLAMPVQPLAFWQGRAKPAATAKEDLVLRRWGVFVATAIMAFAGWRATYDTIALGGVTRLEAVCLTLLAPLFLALALWFCTAVVGFVSCWASPRIRSASTTARPRPCPGPRPARRS